MDLKKDRKLIEQTIKTKKFLRTQIYNPSSSLNKNLSDDKKKKLEQDAKIVDDLLKEKIALLEEDFHQQGQTTYMKSKNSKMYFIVREISKIGKIFLWGFSILIAVILTYQYSKLYLTPNTIYFHSSMQILRSIALPVVMSILALVIAIIGIYFFMKKQVKEFYDTVAQHNSEDGTRNQYLTLIIIKYDKLLKSSGYTMVKFNELFKTLKDNNLPFKVEVVDNRESFEKVLTSANTKAVLIFGHGQRHGVKVNDEMVYYCDIPKNKEIMLAGQFHCNHHGGKSLKEHLEIEGYDTDELTIGYEINDFIKSGVYLQPLKKIFHKN